VPVASRVPRPTSGSSWISQFTGHPRNCHHCFTQGGDDAEPQEEQEEEDLADASGGDDSHNNDYHECS
jgi:hypothetical protein